MFVIIAGGGRIGYFLLKELIRQDQEVVLIEKEWRRCKEIIDELGHLAIHGDACQPGTLEKAGIARAEMIIANTGHDEDNLIICQIARNRFRVPNSIARINNPKNDEIFKKLGIDSTVNPIRAIMSIIEQRAAHRGTLITLVRERDNEVSETQLISDSPAVNRSIDELDMPESARITTLIRGEDAVALPPPETRLKENDIVILMAKSRDMDRLREIFTG